MQSNELNILYIIDYLSEPTGGTEKQIEYLINNKIFFHLVLKINCYDFLL